MCGGFAFVAADGGRITRGLLLFHGGRLATYLALGAAVGLLGELLNGFIVSLNKVSLLASALMLLLLAWRIVRPLGRSPVHRVSIFIAQRARAFRRLFPLIIGVLTGLLPCGWLYAFLAVALGAGQVVGALSIMFVFWVGTLPILSIVGICPSFSLRYYPRLSSPRVRAALLFIAALFSVIPHSMALRLPDEAGRVSSPPICHGKHLAE